MSSTPHHIRRHVLDLNFRGVESDGPRARAVATDWQKRIWMPLLERVLDEMDTGEDTIVIDRLEVELENLSPAEWNAGAEEVAVERLRDAVRRKVLQTAARGGSAAHRPLEAIAHYLRTGALPWWCPASVKASPGAWLRGWIEQSEVTTITAEVTALLHSSEARTRLAAELTDEIFWKLVQALAGGDSQVWKEEYTICQELLRESKSPTEAFCVACRTAILAAALYMPNTGSAIAHFVNELTPLISAEARVALQAHLAELHDPTSTSRENASENNAADLSSARESVLAALPADALAFGDWRMEDALREEELHTHYLSSGAGAVLLAPFLPAFFKALGLLDGDRIKDVSRATALIHYLASGAQKYGEWELVLPKILCGCSPAVLVPTAAVALLPEEMTEAEALLAAVIEHWSVLKNTSPDGLRQSFLQRDGRLTEKEGAWRLLVQPAAHDVLLQHLPWSISIIKLPWMETPVYVDWD